MGIGLKVEDVAAREDFRKKINELKALTIREIEVIKFKRPPSTYKLGLECVNLDEWLFEHVKGVHLEEAGGDQWMNTFVAIFDYLANPSVKKWNSKILEELINTYLPQLEKNQKWLESIQKRFQKHLRECYSMKETAKKEIEIPK